MNCNYYVFIARGIGTETPSAQPQGTVIPGSDEDAWREALLRKYPTSGNPEMILIDDQEWTHPKVGFLTTDPLSHKTFLDAVYYHLTGPLKYTSAQAVEMLSATQSKHIITADLRKGILRIGVPFAKDSQKAPPESKPLCARCQTVIPPASLFCPECGVRLQA